MTKFDLSLLNLKDVSKPLSKLIETVSKGIGEIYRPVGTVIQAYADAKAMIIHEEANGRKSEIAWRASARLSFLEIRRQKNIDSIVQNAMEALPDKVSNESVDEDWIASFFDSCQDIGDEDMQVIWGKILAGEVDKAGSFSRRTLSLLKTLTKEEATMFTNMCSFIFEVDNEGLYFISPPHAVYEYIRDNGFTTEEEVHLKNIGLLSYDMVYHIFDDRTEIPVHYYNKKYRFLLPKGSDEIDCDVPTFPLTQVGNELLQIAGGKADSAFVKLFCKTPYDDNGVKLRTSK